MLFSEITGSPHSTASTG